MNFAPIIVLDFFDNLSNVRNYTFLKPTIDFYNAFLIFYKIKVIISLSEDLGECFEQPYI